MLYHSKSVLSGQILSYFRLKTKSQDEFSDNFILKYHAI